MAARSAEQNKAAYNMPSKPIVSQYIPPAQYTIQTFRRPNDYFGLPSKTVEYLRAPNGELILPPSVARRGVRNASNRMVKAGNGFGYREGNMKFVPYEVKPGMYNPKSSIRIPPGQDVTVQDFRHRFGDSVIPKYEPLSIIDSFNYELMSKGQAYNPEHSPVVRPVSGFSRSSRRMRSMRRRGTRGGSMFKHGTERRYGEGVVRRAGGSMFKHGSEGGDFIKGDGARSGGDFLKANTKRGGDFITGREYNEYDGGDFIEYD